MGSSERKVVITTDRTGECWGRGAVFVVGSVRFRGLGRSRGVGGGDFRSHFRTSGVLWTASGRQVVSASDRNTRVLIVEWWWPWDRFGAGSWNGSVASACRLRPVCSEFPDAGSSAPGCSARGKESPWVVVIDFWRGR